MDIFHVNIDMHFKSCYIAKKFIGMNIGIH
jgi:hypothetical protein